MVRVRRSSLKVLILSLAAVALITVGCSFALFGSSPDDGNTTGTPGTPGATEVSTTPTPQVAVIGTIDKIEDDHVTVAGQVFVLPSSALGSLEEGDKLVLLVRFECQNTDGNGGDHSGGEDEGDD